MTTLTRRRIDNDHQETWHIYRGDVRVGHIGLRAGVPGHADQWSWSLGLYPGMEPGPRGHHHGGTAATFEQARADFEEQWQIVEPTITEDQFEVWRRSRDFHAWKERMWASHTLLPTQTSEGRSHGVEITNANMGEHIHTAHRGIGA